MNNRQALITIFLEKNTHINLSAIRDEEGVLVKHIQDSLELNKVASFSAGSRVADVGTGWGFPLLPLAMSNPEVHFVGIDSVKKKTVAVNEMIGELGIKNAEVVWSRIEEIDVRLLSRSTAGQWQGVDFVIARAVAYVDKLIPWAYHLLKRGGCFLLMKQVNEEEKAALLEVCKEWKLRLVREWKYQLFEGDIERVIYVIEKP